MLMTYGITALIISLWITRMIVEQRVLFRRTLFDIPLLLFVVSQLLSTIFSIDPYTSFFGYYSRFHGGFLSTLTYVGLFYALVSNLEKKHVKNLLVSALIAAVGAALYAFPEHYGRSPSCFLIASGQGGTPAFDVSCWIQDVKSRVFGTFGQPNWLAAYLITLFPVSLGIGISQLIVKRQNWTVVGLAFLSLTLFFTVLLFTQSRSGMAGLLISLLVFGGVSLGVLLSQHKIRQSKIVGSVLAATLVGMIGISQLYGQSLLANVDSLLARFNPGVTSQTESTAPVEESAPVVNRLDIGGTDSGEIRRIVWNGAINVFRRYPLLGSGVETFAYSYYQDRPVEHNNVSEWDFLYNKAHNEFLNYLATTGIVGLSTYVLLLIWFGVVVVAHVFKNHQVSAEESYHLIGMLAGITALTVSNSLGFSTVMVTVLMFIFFGLTTILVQNETVIDIPKKPLTSWHYSSLIGVGLTVMYVLWMIGSWWSADRDFTQGKGFLRAGYTREGLELLQSAIVQSPAEALFYDELATSYAQVAVSLFQQQDATAAAQLAAEAISTSDQALALNGRHINFLKSRARLFILLGTLDTKYYDRARITLEDTIPRAPTDAKVRYNLALVEVAQGNLDRAQQRFEETLVLKPNYEGARLQLARLYQSRGMTAQAMVEYQTILSSINPNNQEALSELGAIQASASANKK